MKSTRWSMFLITGALLAIAAVELWASGPGSPVAVYAIVDKVVFEPNESNPERIQVWGVFSLQTERQTTNYSAAQKGYMYYGINAAGYAEENLAAWADLRNVAGTGEAVGFGGGDYRLSRSGSIRKATEKPESPDAYPVGNPVLKLGAAQAETVAKLKAVLEAK